ncbi:MAG TPA: YdcF family protein [Pseudolabrys sp.]|nr:YdcF family protein [Pseudolabrys sp.]
MFFILSKVVGLLLLPSNFLILLAIAGVLLMTTRWRRTGVSVTVASVILLAAAGFLPIGQLLLRPLESRFPQWNASRGAPNGIIILGGAISPKLSRDYGEPIVGGDAGRIIAMGKLARAYPDARIVYSGGDGSLLSNQPAEANFVSPLLDNFGVSRDRLISEPRSRNTAENAAFTKDLVKPKLGERWLLVTSAQHMPRAVGCFRAVGFPVEAYPVGWHTDQAELMMPRTFSEGLGQLDSAAYEWIGLLAYRLTGRTNEFLPAP